MEAEPSFKDISSFFEFKDGKQCCLIPDCKSKITTLKKSALYRHFRQKHPSKLKEIEPQQKNDSLAYLRQETIYIIVEHVAVCGRTLNSIEDSSFQKLLKDRLDKLKGTPFELTNNEIKTNLHRYVHEMAERVRARISAEFSGKHYSIMFDSATRHNRALLGINSQTVLNGKLVQRTIGMQRIEVRHTGKNIATMVNELLSNYKMPVKNLVSCTVDNARNVVSAVAKLDAMANESNIRLDNSDSSDDEDENDSLQHHWTDPDFQQHLLTLAAQEMNSDFKSIFYESIECIRCAAHTIQLAIVHGLEDANCDGLIHKARELVKKLRLQEMVLKLEKAGLNIPSIDVVTRWFSTLTMVRNHYLNYLPCFIYRFFIVIFPLHSDNFTKTM